MDYRYFLEDIGNKNLDQNDLDTNILYILCYHIETEGKYPFLQFMMEKIPFCNNLIKEQLVLPHIVNNNGKNIKQLALEKVQNYLSQHYLSNGKVTNDMYKGMVWANNWIVLINISDINVSGLYLSRNSNCWFVLPSEIINTRQICNIDIDADVTNLFIENPKLGILTNPKTNINYILPDAVYTGGEYKSVEFNSIFGNRKTKIYESCGKYFYFYRSYIDAVKDAVKYTKFESEGINKEGTNKEGINRYALFLEGELYMETQEEFSLTDDQIEKMYPESCIIICYSNIHEPKTDILVKEYRNFVSISYHMLDNSKMDNVNNKIYII